MVQAIMEGRKTQTRRIVKPQPPDGCEDNDPCIDWCEFDHKKGFQKCYVSWETSLHPDGFHTVVCPYGKVGDVLWVRETWAPLFVEHGATAYKASVLNLNGINIKEHIVEGRWRPSIHIPKSRSRIFLEITSIKVERLNDITEKAAIAEGVENHELLFRYKDYREADTFWFTKAVNSFRSLWESINGAESWDSNPWVWVIEFKQIKK
jgi:hypothetical protein